MFHSARLKLTAWYLLIILLISISFSIVIYQALLREVYRFAGAQRFRIERRLNDCVTTPDNIQVCRSPLPPDSTQPDPDLVNDIKQRILVMLVIINAGIVVVAGGLSYFLAGQTLKPIQEMMDEQNRFISDASHELRTPLTALKSAMEVNLRDKKLSIAEARKLIEQNITDVDKLQALSDSLLQLSQYQKPSDHLTFEPLSLNQVVAEAVRKVDPLAKRKKITITTTLDDQTVEGNKYSLIDLLIIILDNAIKYSPTETTISLTTKKTDGSVLLTITDQGIGIAPKDIPHIFDRFYRAETSRSNTAESGYGLGLSIAKKIVSLHHGSIKASSEVTKGSTFSIKVPLKQPGKNPKIGFFS